MLLIIYCYRFQCVLLTRGTPKGLLLFLLIESLAQTNQYYSTTIINLQYLFKTLNASIISWEVPFTCKLMWSKIRRFRLDLWLHSPVIRRSVKKSFYDELGGMVRIRQTSERPSQNKISAFCGVPLKTPTRVLQM